VLHEVVGRLLRVAQGDGPIGVEVSGRLEPLDDLLGIDREQGLAGQCRLLQVAAHDGAAHLAHLGHGFAGEEVDERLAFERLVGLAETPGGEMHG